MTGTTATAPEQPLVTIITGTWQRSGHLFGAIKNVREQTHRRIEHLVVSDGPDPILPGLMQELAPCHIPLRYLALGRNTTGFFPDSYAIGPLIAGCLVASGDFIGYLPDDDRMDRRYVEKLVAKLEATGADFAYSKAKHVRGNHVSTIGRTPPSHGQIGNFLHRTELLKKSMWQLGDGVSNDWALVQRWIDAGAKHAFVNETLFTHNADH